jgi:hypothetical protein
MYGNSKSNSISELGDVRRAPGAELHVFDVGEHAAIQVLGNAL